MEVYLWKEKNQLFFGTIVLIILLTFCLVALTGCTSNGNNEIEPEIDESRFVKISETKGFDSYTEYILYDKETLVMYIFIEKYGYKKGFGGLTVMLDADGKPLLYNQVQE